MGRTISVNWAELKKSSDKFQEESNEIKDIMNQFNSNFNQIKQCWTGVDADNFVKNCTEVTRLLKLESLYLDVWSEFLSKSSNRYNGNVEDGLSRMNNIEASFDDIVKR